MTLEVRAADLGSDREELLGLLERNLPDLAHRTRFSWLYEGNPNGSARAWFVVEKETQNAVGTASLFPRSIWVGSTTLLCGQVGDFAIEPSYRSLGLAVIPQPATLEPVNAEKLESCHDYLPNPLSTAHGTIDSSI
jgi:hypothetical protein